MTVHDHHWTCPTDNGCGYHIQCGTPESNIPDDHKFHASCWFSEHGCEEADVRKCTHECPFGGTFFNGPEFYRVSVSKPNALALGCRHRPLVLDQNFFLT